ncbi:MAG TPA: PQQ-binding-like beta-propeller repeat protein, partial [Humisphaera sp.]
GPAYGAGAEPPAGAAAAAATEEWPALLGGTSRSSATAAAAPGELPVAFTAKVPLAKPTGPYAADWAEDNQRCGAVTPPVVAGGRVLVASTDAHTLHALDPATGKILWSYQTGGRIDSPPTVYRGLALFGSHDGHVYALRLADGQLAWRFLAAPGRRNIVVSGQVECLWPVRGSVTILDGKLYATAGRHNQTDGGVFLWRLDPVTGAAEASATIDDRDSSGSPPGPALKDYHGRIADVLSVNDAATWLYMGPVAIHPKSLAWCNLSVVPQVPAKNVAVPASFIPGGPDLNWKTEGVLNFLCAPTTGIVDRRSNVGGSKGQGGFRWNAVDGYRGGLRAERMAKVGRTIIGARGATLVAWDLDEKGKPKGGDRADPREVAKLPAQRPAALVAAGDRFVLATPASGGKTTAAVTVLNRDGTTAASAAVPAPVVTYGLAVAGGRVYAALEDGTLMCFGQ